MFIDLSLNLLMDGLEVVNKIWLIKPLLITRIIMYLSVVLVLILPENSLVRTGQ